MSMRLIYDDAVVKIITEEAETLEREWAKLLKDMRHVSLSMWNLDSCVWRLHTDKSHTTRFYDYWLDYPSHIQYV